jgi:phenylacetate-CoA ligase
MAPQLSKANHQAPDDLRHVRALAPKLARTEQLSSRELEAYRAPLLSKLLGYARENVPYYAKLLDFDVSSPEEISRQWSQIPILTRAEAVRSRERLISSTVPAEAGAVTEKRTSGSTGMPLRYQATTAFDQVACALTERMFRWWRVDGNKAFAQIATSSRENARLQGGTTTSCWHTARPQGVKHVLSHLFDIDTQLDWLLARRPAYLATFSGIIKELAATARRRGSPLELDLVFSSAAVLDQETRELCRSVFGAEIADTFGAQEAGHLAAQCPDCGEYHLSADAAVVEILRDDGSPAAANEIGRVVVTPLHNYAMPLIRYELGDCAEVGTAEPPCGRKLPTVRRILGRYRNLFRFRDGTRIWPVASGFDLHNYMALRQFQVVQTDLDHIEIKYVPGDGAGFVDIAGLTERVRRVLGQPVDVTACPVEKIERATPGKFEDCVSLVPADGARI